MSSSYLMNLLASAVAVIVGIVIHESAHAATDSYKKLGDTAYPY